MTRNFGLEAKFIAVICNEAAMTTDADLWIAIIKLTAFDKIKTLWLVGDHKQLKARVTSKYAEFNFFGMQLELSIFTRTILEGHEHFELELCGRMHRDILNFAVRESVVFILFMIDFAELYIEIQLSSTSKNSRLYLT